MKMISACLLCAFVMTIGSCGGPREPAVTGEEISYSADGVALRGYLAVDANREGKRPGILVVHEWWGHNDYTRRRARMLAELGYTALAVDMYGDGKQAPHPEDAGKFAAEVMQNMGMMKARFQAALDTLRNHETVDPARLGAIGYCFGGGVVLNMARMGADLDGVVSFHGSLATTHPAQFGTIATKILVCNGSDDTFIPREQIDAFKKEMDEANVDYRFIDYEGATHSWTNPDADTYARQFGMPVSYNAAADSLSWNDMKDFFAQIFNP